MPARFTLTCAALCLAGCATASASPRSASATVALGETADLGAIHVTPLAVFEDSRCPRPVACVWAGQVRISARIVRRSRGETRELTSGKPQRVAGGSLVLSAVTPPKLADVAIRRDQYRFTLAFAR